MLPLVPLWNPTPPVLEKEVRIQVTKLLELFNFYVKWPEQSNDRKRARSHYTKGVPDIVAAHRTQPIAVWIECKGIKAGHNEASKEQLEFQEIFVRAGQQVIIGKTNIHSKGGYTEVADALVRWGLARSDDE